MPSKRAAGRSRARKSWSSTGQSVSARASATSSAAPSSPVTSCPSAVKASRSRPGPAAEIEDRVGRLALDGVQQGRDVLAHVVVGGAVAVGLGHAVVFRERQAAASRASASSPLPRALTGPPRRRDGRNGASALDLAAREAHEPARERTGRRAGDARLPQRARAQGAVAVVLDGPQREPSAACAGRAQGGRPPGVLRLGGDADDGALLRRAGAERPCRREAPREPGVPRDPVPLRQPDQGQAGRFPGLRRRPELSLAHQGQRRRGHLHRLGRARASG